MRGWDKIKYQQVVKHREVKKNTQLIKRIIVDFISLIFTLWSSLSATPQQGGRAGGFHLLRY
jgi:hypothetical protein